MTRWIIMALAMCVMHGKAVGEGELVVLLHGLARTPASMSKLGKALRAADYNPINIGYPSRSATIPELALLVRDRIAVEAKGAERIHFVTHSMGGIVLREIQRTAPIDNIGRVVMMAPPNQGSEIVDAFGDWQLYEWLNGPAGLQLGTGDDGFIAGMGAVDFDLGVIAGSRSVNPVLSRFLDGPNDGKVSVRNTRVEGMTDFVALPVSHTFMMQRRIVIRQVINYLDEGSFQ